MTITRVKFAAFIVFAIAIFAVFAFKTEPTRVFASSVEDPAAIYKAKCAACHGKKAEKFYDPAQPDDEQVQAILKGKKGAKPPYMPGFESKGIKEDDAKALVEYMKGLKNAAD